MEPWRRGGPQPWRRGGAETSDAGGVEALIVEAWRKFGGVTTWRPAARVQGGVRIFTPKENNAREALGPPRVEHRRGQCWGHRFAGGRGMGLVGGDGIVRRGAGIGEWQAAAYSGHAKAPRSHTDDLAPAIRDCAPGLTGPSRGHTNGLPVARPVPERPGAHLLVPAQGGAWRAPTGTRSPDAKAPEHVALGHPYPQPHAALCSRAHSRTAHGHAEPRTGAHAVDHSSPGIGEAACPR